MNRNNDEEILKVDVLGRVRTTAQRREALLDAFEESGLPGTKFAERYGINYQTFASWIQNRRRKRGDYVNGESVGQKVSAESEVPSPPVTFAEVVVSEPSVLDGDQEDRFMPGLRIELSGGVAVVISDESQASLAVDLIEQLAARVSPC